MYIAHVRESDGSRQPLSAHLLGVADLAERFAAKIQMPQSGKVSGLPHDFGKYSTAFQNYVESATGLLDPDHDDYLDAKALKGTINHSTAGAQHIWQQLLQAQTPVLPAQILSLCMASHHSGLIDCLKPGGDCTFAERTKTYLEECPTKVDKEIETLAETLSDSVPTPWLKMQPPALPRKSYLDFNL